MFRKICFRFVFGGYNVWHGRLRLQNTYFCIVSHFLSTVFRCSAPYSGLNRVVRAVFWPARAPMPMRVRRVHGFST